MRTCPFPLTKLLVVFLIFLNQLDPVYSLPKKIYVSLFFNSVTKIDGVEQSFYADFYFTAYWQDNSLTFNETYDPTLQFQPGIEFSNSRGTPEKQVDNPYTLTTPDGDMIGAEVTPNSVWVKYDQRYIGNFNTKLNLEDFPFDNQDVVLWVESEVFDFHDVLFVGVPRLSTEMIQSDEDEFEIIEWKILGASVEEKLKYYKIFDQTYSRLEIKISLRRQSDFYLWKVIFGSILVVLMAIVTFVLDVKEPDRMMGTLTVFLALVSFLFVAGTSIPKVAYQTKMDLFFNFSFFIVFFILLAHALNYLIMSREIMKSRKEVRRKDSIEMNHLSTEPGHKPTIVEADNEEINPGQCIDPKSLSSKLDIAFFLIFLFAYAIGCCVFLINPITKTN